MSESLGGSRGRNGGVQGSLSGKNAHVCSRSVDGTLHLPMHGKAQGCFGVRLLHTVCEFTRVLSFACIHACAVVYRTA